MPAREDVYFDTSALAKWYLNEPHSEAVAEYIQERGPVAISGLTIVERLMTAADGTGGAAGTVLDAHLVNLAAALLPFRRSEQLLARWGVGLADRRRCVDLAHEEAWPASRRQPAGTGRAPPKQPQTRR